MAINLSALSSITTSASALSNLVLVTPENKGGYRPQNKPNKDGTESKAQPPPTLLFNYEGEQTVTLESDITDHYVEDNTAVQDQISLKPELITAQGYIGELNDVAAPGIDFIKSAADRLTAITAYAPNISRSASVVYAQADLIYRTATKVADTAVAAWSSLTGSGSSVQNKQQIMFSQFYGYWRSRTLFTVQTPWAIFKNCAIMKIRAVQSADSNLVSEFEVVFKPIRVAKTIASNLTTGLSFLDGRAGAQMSPLTDLGSSAPIPSIPFSSGLSSMGLA